MTGLVRRRDVDRDELIDEVAALFGDGQRLALITCHDDGDRFRIAYSFIRSREQPIELIVTVAADDPWVPSLATLSYPAGQFEREMHDLYGLRARAHPQPHRLLRHAHWPHEWHPMRRDAAEAPVFEPDTAAFPFVEVEGDGVYEIPVGPVHAGIIEPGHFRFSVVGETILRTEARLWFLHRGIEKLFEGRSATQSVTIAEQITGDTSVGHALAYTMAVEDAAGIDVPEHDRRARALLLELERLYNHITDLGALANDTGFAIANTQAQRIRETLMRLNHATTGHRLLRGGLVVGGTVLRSLPDAVALRTVARDAWELVDITLDHPIVRDRFTGTAVLGAEQARELGAVGFVARASGIDIDARRDAPFVDLGSSFEPSVETGGDVLARYLVRAREFAVSASLALELVEQLSGRSPEGIPADRLGGGSGIALVEAWRGTLACRVELDRNGRLARVKIADPSFFNWSALPVALADTIVPDFPLANKSFNQSYAGNDL